MRANARALPSELGGSTMHKFALALAAISVAMPAQAQAPKVRALQDIYKAGFKDCAPAMERFVKFVHDDDEAYSFVSKFAVEDTNRSTAGAVTVERFSDSQGVASITATKNAAGKCDVVLTHTFVFPEMTCDALRAEALKDWKLFLKLNEANVYEDPTTPNGHAVVSPAGKGCLLVKHLMGFDIEAS